ncbi:MAG TPA: ABC transporter ATP-binding protein [Micromonosporaceae bacterium]|nr:ABC transporter ATP-binding protein [Micromonosporaceae bacterium]
MAAIVVAGLGKCHGALRAVDDLSFTVAEGEVLALLGPNGAGKTTTVEILEGYRERTSGEVSVLGFDPATGGRAYRERIGVVLQSAGFDEQLTVRELVRLHASLYPRAYHPDDVIDLVGLSDKRTVRIATLSGGQRRRLDLALGLVGVPELLFLDEPTTGFDPGARHRAWDLVDQLRELGTTILLTTHYIEEAERLADRVAVMRAGRLVALGRPGELGAGRGAVSTLRFRLPAGASAATLPALSAPLRVTDGSVEVRTAAPPRDTYTLTGWALERGLDLPALTVTRPTLEEVYLRLVGSTAEGSDEH